MTILNYFDRNFIENRVSDICDALVKVNTHFSAVVGFYLVSRIYDRSNDIPIYYTPGVDDDIVEKFFKKHKFNLYSDNFDLDRFVECVKNEKYTGDPKLWDNFIADLIDKHGEETISDFFMEETKQ